MSNLIFGSRRLKEHLTSNNIEDWKFHPTSSTHNDLPKGIFIKNLIVAGSPWLGAQDQSEKYIAEFIRCIEYICKNNEVEKLIYVSSAAVYGLVTVNKLPLSEDAKLAGKSKYASEKIKCEKICQQLFDTERLKTLFILRPAGFYGTLDNSQKPVNFLDRLQRAFASKNAEKFTLDFSGQQQRDFCSYSDFIQVIKDLLDLNVSGDFKFNLKSTSAENIINVALQFVSRSQLEMRESHDEKIHSVLSCQSLQNFLNFNKKDLPQYDLNVVIQKIKSNCIGKL